MKKTLILTWTIENFSKISSATTIIPAIAIDEEKQRWRLEVYSTNNKSTYHPNSFSCYLKETSEAGIEGDCTVQLISPKGKVFFSKTETFNHIFEAVLEIQRLKNEIKEWNEDVLTVQWVMNIKNSKLHSASDLKAVSEIGIDHNTLAWCFKAPDSLMWKQRKVFSNTENLSLEVAVETNNDDIFIEVKDISKVDIGCQSVRRKISLIDENHDEILSTKDTFIIGRASNKLSWTLPTNFKNKVFKENNSTVSGYFIVILEILDISEEPEKPSKQTVEDTITVLQCDLKQMLLDKKHSDVNLKADGQLFCAHKCLLSSRSPVFRAMFDSDILESQTNVVEINDLDSTILESLLKFLYTGIIDACNCENTLKLLLAADKYQVESLTEKCAEILMNLLSAENVLDVIEIADLVKHKDLKASALDLLKEHASDILSSTEWLEWSKQNLQLAFEISSKLAVQCSLELQLNTKK